MSRTAKIVSVLPTAQRQPAITPHNTRCGTCRASRNVSPVPRTNAGRLQREIKAPRTIMNEITMGETATVTNFVGASAPASQSAAAKPQNIPSLCSSRCRERSGSGLPKSALKTVSPVFIVLSVGAAILLGERPAEPGFERPGRTALQTRLGLKDTSACGWFIV